MTTKDKARKKAKRPDSLIKMIVRSISLCLGLIIGFIILCYAAADFVEDYAWDVSDISHVEKQQDELKSENYDKVNVPSIFGFNEYFEILNKDARVLYSSNPSKKNTLTTGTSCASSPVHDKSRAIIWKRQRANAIRGSIT
ncbi:MAG: hypothetical protein ACOX4I_04795 [Anaerovoracaceae bacterium]|jgi:hypothetical protein